MIRVYGISGLGADERVFKYISLNYPIIPIPWLRPFHKESIEQYCHRIVEKHHLNKNSEEVVLIGVSFGGIIATEISKLIKNKETILISSVAKYTDLRLLYRAVGFLKLAHLMPRKFLIAPAMLIAKVFGTRETKLIRSILHDTDPYFVKWAIIQITNWRNKTLPNQILKISGEKDLLLPPSPNDDIVIKNGRHFMIVDKADQISDIINNRLPQLHAKVS